MESGKGLVTFQSYTETFEQLCPYYMSIGMTYDEFWYKDVKLAEYYRKAEELRVQRKNQEAWLQGMYIYEALCDASPLFRFTMKKGTIKPEPYAKEPYPITEKEVEQRKERDAKLKEERLRAEFELFVQRMVERRKQIPVDIDTDSTVGDEKCPKQE